MSSLQGGRHSYQVALGLFAALIALAASGVAQATVYDLYPPSLNPLLTLQPGDTAILHAGTYNRVYTAGMTGGTAGNWITIKGAPGEARPKVYYGASDKNMFELSNAAYIRFQDVEVQGGSFAFRFQNTCHDITLENVYMHDCVDGGVIASGVTELYNLTVRNCEIANISTGGIGEAFYLGKHDYITGKQVHDSLIERNWIHDVVEGVEIKAGCTNITVQDNVISANRGAPSMTIYGTYKTDPALGYTIRRNFIYGSSDSGIQCTSDATITDNVIVNSQYNGISIRQRNLSPYYMQNITIANNTFYGAASTCLQISNGDTAVNVVIANNAIYQSSAGATAFNAASAMGAGVTLANNLYYGTSNATSPGLVLGASPAAAFVNASTTLGQMDVYPLAGSPLIDAASATYTPADDFNWVARPQGATSDIGAYEASGTENPGWKLAAGFRALSVVGDTNLDGHVDLADLMAVAGGWGKSLGQTGFNAAADFNADNIVDVVDLLMLARNFGL